MVEPAEFGAQQSEYELVEPKLTWGHLSPGYAGLSVPQLTLNSQFFGLLFEKTRFVDLSSMTGNFPQRVPRLGFFEELCETEKSALFQGRFLSLRRQLSYLLKDLESRKVSGKLSDQEAQNFLRTMDLAARYGLLEDVVRLEPAGLPSQMLNAFLFKKLTYKISWKISVDEEPPLEELCRFFETLQEDSSEESAFGFLRAMTAQRIIVTGARHSSNVQSLDFFRKLADYLLGFVEAHPYKKLRPEERLSLSMIYRALPMVKGTEMHIQKQLLDKSWEALDHFSVNNDFDQIIKSEQQLTTLQSFAKFHLAAKEPEEALRCFRQMMELDPLDSTAYSEQGLFYFKANSFNEALPYFKRAVELGPPALALNYFYKGECERNLGLLLEATESFCACSEVDTTAISPLLSLFELYKVSGMTALQDEVRRKILGDPILTSQLTQEEQSALNDL